MTTTSNTLIFVLFFCVFQIHSINAQEAHKDLYNYYDEINGKQNLEIFNGTIHVNRDVTIGDQHRYLSNTYEQSNISYMGQVYFNIATKYDIFNDVLVLQPHNNSSTLGINAITAKVDSFSYSGNGQKFVNLERLKYKNAKIGYYEKVSGSKIVLYVKHIKKSRETISNNRNFLSYTYRTNYFITYDGALYELNSEKSLTNLFPNLKTQISSFYKENKVLQKNNYLLFIEKLIAQLNSAQA